MFTTTHCAFTGVLRKGAARIRHSVLVRSFSALSRLAQHGASPRWIDEEDDKIRELLQMGKTAREIMPSLPGRTYQGVRSRATLLKSYDEQRVGESLPQPWTPEEDSLLERLMEEGTSLPAARKHFPNRALHSVRFRWEFRLSPKAKALSRSKVRKRYTESEINEVIRRYKAGATIHDIAEGLDRSYSGIKFMLQKWVPMKYKRTAGGRPGSKYWTADDTQKLHRLYNANTPYAEIGAHFPGKSNRAIRHRVGTTQARLRDRTVAGSAITIVELRARLLQLRLARKSWAEIRKLFQEIKVNTLRDNLRIARKKARLGGKDESATR